MRTRILPFGKIGAYFGCGGGPAPIGRLGMKFELSRFESRSRGFHNERNNQTDRRHSWCGGLQTALVHGAEDTRLLLGCE